MKKRLLGRLSVTAFSVLACLALSGCGLGSPGDAEKEASEDVFALDGQDSQTHSGDPETDAETPRQSGQEPDSGVSQAARGHAEGGPQRGNRIEEQTFDVNLRPLGQVTFSAYEPDTSANALADVVLLIEKDGQVLMQLSGTTEDNVGPERFHQVEAVSFTDYNSDGLDDIIIIVSYCPGAGPQTDQPCSLIRYYSGTASDGFFYEAEMSDNASMALTEITIETAKDFISGKRGELPAEEAGTENGLKDGAESGARPEPWQQAYLKYLSEESDPQMQTGYTLIQLSDDGIPQIAEIGTDEATGSRIVHYGGGKVHVTQMSRLHFSYIPGENLLCNSEGNMDTYYDLVFRLENGELNLIASGYYGAQDNSNVQFDESGEPIYQYEWNGVQMSREEYHKELMGVYDLSKSESYDYDSLYSVEELKKLVEQYGTTEAGQ